MTNEARVREIAPLPCPFCGGDAEFIDCSETDNRGGRAISCTNLRCEASSNVQFGDNADALLIERWNKRVIAALPVQSSGLTEDETIAVAQLRDHQEQCDMDGVMVKVSRQAVDEVLAIIDRLSTPQQGTGEPVSLIYTNYRGETAKRTIIPKSVRFGSTEWHPEPQWLLLAFDADKQADREFALKDFGPPSSPDRERALEEWASTKPFRGVLETPATAFSAGFDAAIRAMESNNNSK